MCHGLDEQIYRSRGRAATKWNRMLRHARPGVSHPPDAPAISPIESGER